MIEMILGFWVLLQAAVPGTPGKPLDAQAKPATAVEPQDPDRPAISASDLKALNENNVFSPHTKRRTPPSNYGSKTSRPPSPPAKPKPPAVTGIFFDLKTQDYLVIVEDRNTGSARFFKEPKFLKAGDEVLGIKVQSVTQEKAVFLKGETPKEAHVGDSLPETDAKPVGAATSSTDDSELGDEEDPAPKKTVTVEGKDASKENSKSTESKSTDTRPTNDVLEELKKKNMKRRTRE